MGTVYRARKLGSDREVALKLGPNTQDPVRLKRFRREGELTADLRHPNIVAVHDAGVVNGQPFLAYHFVEGARTLVDTLGGWGLRQQISALRDVAGALGHAHARGVVHRDVKPDNVLVTAEGSVLLADFGLANAAGLERLTRSQALMGTALYMAPEQAANSHEAGPEADVYSVGLMLYTALVGVHPFAHLELQSLFSPGGRRVSPPHKKNPSVPKALSAVCLRALEVDPSKRYSDGNALASALEAWLQDKPIDGGSPAWRNAGLAAGAAILAVAVYGVWGGPAPADPTTRSPELVEPPAQRSEQAEIPDPPRERPLSSSEQRAFDDAVMQLASGEFDPERLHSRFLELHGALSPHVPAHSVLADALCAYLVDPDLDWEGVGLPLLTTFSRTGAQPSKRNLAESLCEALYWAVKREDSFRQDSMRKGLTALVRMDVDVEGVDFAWKRRDPTRRDEDHDSRAYRYLTARFQGSSIVISNKHPRLADLQALGRDDRLGPTTRARALADTILGQHSPDEGVAIAEEALSLDPDSPHVQLAHARALLWANRPRAVEAHERAWVVWRSASRKRIGSVEHEATLVPISERALLANGHYAAAKQLLGEFDSAWPGKGWVSKHLTRIERMERGAAPEADRAWIRTGEP